MPFVRKHGSHRESYDSIWDSGLVMLTATVAFVLTALFVLLWDMF